MRKTLLRFAMTCIVAVLAVNFSMAAVSIPTTGFCGDGDDLEAVQWSFDMLSGTLTISGEGEMADFASGDAAPWYSWQSDITNLIVEEGVTRIGNYACFQYPQLKSVSMAGSVFSIGECALAYNSSLATITCMATMTIPWIEPDILEGCSALTAIYVPEAAVDSYQNATCWSPYCVPFSP